MKKYALIFLFAAAAATTLSAQDTLTVINPSKVQVITASGSQQVEIFGSETDSSYFYSTSIETGSSSIVRTRERRMNQGLDFSVPLIGTEISGKSGRKAYGGVDLAIDTGFGICFPSELKDAAYDPMRQAWGLDFYLGILSAEFHPWGNSDHVYMKFGLEDRSFKIRGDQRYIKNAQGVLDFAPVDGNPKWSALRIFSWNLSAGYYQHLYKDFGIFVEPILNFNTSSRIKTKWYDADGKQYKDKVKKVGLEHLVTYELMGGIKMGNIKLYVKYNPCNLIEAGHGPDFNTWSVGIIL